MEKFNSPITEELKYKRLSKTDISKIQKMRLPQYSIPIVTTEDFNKMNTESINIIKEYTNKTLAKEQENSDFYIICEMAKLYLDTIKEKNKMNDLSKEIKQKAELIANALEKGLHVELCTNKDGLRIISLDRKVVK